jgi:hypothetical protein
MISASTDGVITRDAFIGDYKNVRGQMYYTHPSIYERHSFCENCSKGENSRNRKCINFNVNNSDRFPTPKKITQYFPHIC